MILGTFEDSRPVEIPAQDFLTKKIQILAKTDSGKSYLASKIAEEMLKEKLPICIVDPVSAYWGLKEKFEIITFGDKRNTHADHYLVEDRKTIPAQAELIADFLATNPDSAIIDLKYWVDSNQQRFMAAFASRLYLRNKIPRHIFIEEADVFCPQTVQFPDEINSRHYVDQIARRGRQEGLGCTVISQRPALVSKNILTQSDISFYLCLSGYADLAPARNELKDDNDLPSERKNQIISQIKKLPRGQAFMYSPRWLKTADFMHVGKKETYHAGATRGALDYREESEIKLVPINIEIIKTTLERLAKTQEKPSAVSFAISDSKEVQQALEDAKTALANAKVDFEKKKQELEGQITTLQTDLEKSKLAATAFEQFRNLILEIVTTRDKEVTVNSSSFSLDLKVRESKISINEDSYIGRIARLIAENFFAFGKTKKEIVAEILVRYNLKSSGRIYEAVEQALAELCTISYSYLRQDGEKYLPTDKKIKIEVASE